MEHLLVVLVLAFFSVARVGANAYNNEIETYWRSVLPNAVMPRSLEDLIPHGAGDKKIGYGPRVADSDLHSFNLAYNVNITSYYHLFYYKGAQSSQSNRLIDTNNQILYFFEKDLHEGKKMKLRFVSDNKAAFLPRRVADSIPFSSKKLPQILKQLSIKPGSKQAKVLKTTISICEQPGIKGENKYCATSLESMIDFITLRLGKNVQVLATELNGKGKSQIQSYALVRVGKAIDKSIVCHNVAYPYAVYFCHEIPDTRCYSVSLVGADGLEVKGLAVCHVDTSAWDPNFLAFKILKVKPGTVPICHFLAKDTIVWVPN